MDIRLSDKHTKIGIQSGMFVIQLLTAMVLCPQAPAVSSAIGVAGIAYTFFGKPTRGFRSLGFADILFLVFMAGLAAMTLEQVLPAAIGYWTTKATGAASRQ